MPPHTGAFIKKTVFDNAGGFKTNFKISGDYEWFCRIAKLGHFSQKVDENFVTVAMSRGASSKNLLARWVLHKEIARGLRANGLNVSHARLATRYFRKALRKYPTCQ